MKIPAVRGLARAPLLLSTLVLLLATAGPAIAGEGSIRHGLLMRGQVLESEGRSVVVCVGKKDGAEVGQVFEVVRHVRVSRGTKSAAPKFRREDVGSVKVTSLFDDHYATADVVTGSPNVNDTVELKQ